ncbi:MAG: PAS domain-containing protein, partial [Burkholderiaceae bacterium]
MSEKVASPVDLSHLSPHAPELAAAFASIASDLALVIDANGTIVSVSALRSPLGGSTSDWIGKKWVDTVTQETRRKVEMLLEEVRRTGVSQRREVNHPSASGDDIPIAYAAIQLGDAGPVLVAGRDLRAIAAIQQRFVQSQQEMERDYWLRRREETRYRLLFQVAT